MTKVYRVMVKEKCSSGWDKIYEATQEEAEKAMESLKHSKRFESINLYSISIDDLTPENVCRILRGAGFASDLKFIKEWNTKEV